MMKLRSKTPRVRVSIDSIVYKLEGIEEIALRNNLIDPVVRMEELGKLYPLITPSYIKAKVAFALGHHTALYVDNLQSAEQVGNGIKYLFIYLDIF